MLSLLRTFILPLTLCGGAAQAQQPEAVCHRGANLIAPENTYAAAREAYRLGANWVEIDVRQSRDGTHYLMHDMTLGRTTNGKGLIRFARDAELDTLDAGVLYPDEHGGEPIPRLRAYMAWAKEQGLNIYIDIKKADVDTLIDIVRSLGMEDRTMLWGWKRRYVRRLHRKAPELTLKMNVASVRGLKKHYKRYGIQVAEMSLEAAADPKVRATCEALGIKVMVIVLDGADTSRLPAAIATDPDYVNLDHPEVFYELTH